MNTPTNTKRETDFLSLPDWYKLDLKINTPLFFNYPTMTEKQLEFRFYQIEQFNLHFSPFHTFNFLNNNITNQIYWANYLEFWLTPKLLDLISPDIILEFGICYCCKFFEGYNKRILHKAIGKNTIFPIYGDCKVITHFQNKNKYGISFLKNQRKVKPKFRCIGWRPLNFYKEIIGQRIINILCSSNEYYFDDYLKDLEYITLWDFLLDDNYNQYEQLSTFFKIVDTLDINK